MTYNPSIDMPRNLEEFNSLIDYYTNLDAKRYQEQCEAVQKHARESYAKLPEKDKPTLEEWLAQSVAYVEKPRAREDFEKLYSCYYPQETPAPEPEPSFEAKKRMKLGELGAAFDMACESAVIEVNGLVINANETANRNVDGLIKKLEAEGSSGPVNFCLADNSFAPVTLDTLKAMQLGIITKGQELYAQKWIIREAINAAQDESALNAVSISFS